MADSVRTVSTRDARFAYPDHHTWWVKRMEERTTLIYVADDGHQVRGFIRYGKVEGKEEAEIAVAVADSVRREGIATSLLGQTADGAMVRLGVSKLIALVVKGNTASDALFGSLGFVAVGDEERIDKQHTRWELSA